MRRNASPHPGTSYRAYNAPSPSAGASTPSATVMASASTIPRLAALTPTALVSLAALPLSDDVRVSWTRYSLAQASDNSSETSEASAKLMRLYSAMLRVAHVELTTSAGATQASTPLPSAAGATPSALSLLSGMLCSLEWEALATSSSSPKPAPTREATPRASPRKSSLSTPSRGKRKASVLDEADAAHYPSSRRRRRRLRAVWTFTVQLDNNTSTASTVGQAMPRAKERSQADTKSVESGSFRMADLYRPKPKAGASVGAKLLSSADVAPNEELVRAQEQLCSAIARRAVLAWSSWCAVKAEEVQAETSDSPKAAAPTVQAEEELEEGQDEEATAFAEAASAKATNVDIACPLGPTTLLLLPKPREKRKAPPSDASALSIRATLTPGALLLHARPHHLPLRPLEPEGTKRGANVVLAPSGREATFVEVRHSLSGMEESTESVRCALEERGVKLPKSFQWVLCSSVPLQGDSIESLDLPSAFLYPLPLLFQSRCSNNPLPLSAPRQVKGLHSVPPSLALVTSTMDDMVHLARKLLSDAQGRSTSSVRADEGTGMESKAAKGTFKTPIAFDERLELPNVEHGGQTERDGYVKDEEAEEGEESDSDVPMSFGVAKGERGEEEAPGDNSGTDRDLWGELFAGGAEEGDVEAEALGAAQVESNGAPDVLQNDSSVRHLRRSTLRGEEDGFGYDGTDGFGLLTEDDFSFFDDAAAAAAAADGVQVTANGNGIAHAAVGHQQDAMDVDAEQTSTFAPLLAGESAAASPEPAAASSESSTSSVRLDSTGAAVMDAAQHSSEMDPPSLPGFTPSSFFSASSPAFGGLVGKTPRTPFSPGQDLADHNISVVGAEPSLSGLYQLQGSHAALGAGAEVRTRGAPNQHDFSAATGQENVPHAAARPRAATALDALSQQQRMREVGSKYEGGKFAVLPTAFGARVDEADATGGANGPASAAQAKNGKLLRTSASRATLRRQTSRIKTAQEWRPPSNDEPHSLSHLTKRGTGYTALALPAIHKLRLLDRAHGMGGAEEELMSEMDTVEGTISELSDGDDSDDSDEEVRERAEREQRIKVANERTEQLLRAATELVEAHDAGAQALSLTNMAPTVVTPTSPRRYAAPASPTNSAESSFTDWNPEDGEERDRRWAVLVGWLARNPQMRLVVTPAEERSSRASVASPTRISASHSAAALRCLSHLVDGAAPSLASLLGEVGSSNQPRMEVLEPPHVLVGCQGVVTRFESTALHFWDKLALSAAGGPRRVTAFALCIESSPPEWVADVTTWLARVEHGFASLGLGTHQTAKDHVLALAGNVGIAQSIDDVSGDAETWNDTLQSLVSRMKGSIAADRHVVLYAVGKPVYPIPFHAFVRLQEGLRAVATRRFGVAGLHITVRPVPSLFVCEATRTAGALAGVAEFDFRRFAISVYDDLRIAVGPAGPCPPSHEVARVPDMATAPVQYPAFTLDTTRTGHARMPRFELKWPFTVYNVLERGTMLHFAYDMDTSHASSSSNDAVIVSVIDERAQAHHVTCWRSKMNVEQDICAIWAVIQDQASRLSVDLRIVVCKSSAMSREELRAWSEVAVAHPLTDLTLLCADTSLPLALAGPYVLGKETAAMLKDLQLRAPPATGATSGAVMLDASHSAYALYPRHCLPISPLVDEEGFDADLSQDTVSHTTAHPPLLSLASSLTVRIPNNVDGTTRVSPKTDGSTFDASAVTSVGSGGAPHLLWLHMLAVHIPASSAASAAPSSSSATSAAATPGDAASSSTSAVPTPVSPLDAHQGVEAHDLPETRMRDITRSYAALEFISRSRFALDSSLPWPLAVLAAVKPGLKACQ